MDYLVNIEDPYEMPKNASFHLVWTVSLYGSSTGTSFLGSQAEHPDKMAKQIQPPI